MANLNSILAGVDYRLEEVPGAAIFWNESNELYPLIVEAMNLACLITGEPQFRATTTFTIPASTSFAPIALPVGALALLRVDSSGTTVDKAYIQDLDNFSPGWEVMTGPVPQYWMPYGLGQFGISPCLTAPVKVVLSYVQYPVLTSAPYTGAETIPYQQEYFDGFVDFASGIASFKEGGQEFQLAIQRINRALEQFEQLSSFAYRKGSLRFTRGLGSTANIVETRVR